MLVVGATGARHLTVRASALTVDEIMAPSISGRRSVHSGATVAAKNKKRKSDWNEGGGGDDEGRGGGARRRSKSTKKSAMSPGGTVQSPTSTSSAGHAGGDGTLMVKTEEGNKVMGEVGMVVDEDAKPAGAAAAGLNASGNDEEALNGSSGTSMENWSEQPTMKVKV